MKQGFLIFCLAWFLMPWSFGIAGPQDIHDIQFITENYPPYNFEENGELKGIWVDVLVAVLKKMDAGQTRKNIRVMPWARGYRLAQNTPNTCLFLTVRTIEREHLFKWAGPATQGTYVLISLKNMDIRINNLEGAARFRTGVVKDDYTETMLLNHGVPKDQLICSFGEHPAREIIERLNQGFVDLWFIDYAGARWMLKNYGFFPHNYKIVHKGTEPASFYAFSKGVPDELVAEFQTHLDAVMNSPVFKEIENQYLTDDIPF